MVSSAIWEKHALMSSSKTHKLHSSFGLVQSCTLLKNSLVHVFPKLHSKPYYYLYKLLIKLINLLYNKIIQDTGFQRLDFNEAQKHSLKILARRNPSYPYLICIRYGALKCSNVLSICA